MVLEVSTNDLTFQEILDCMEDPSDGFEFLEAVLTADPADGLLPEGLTPAELIGQLCRAAVKAQSDKNLANGLVAPNRINAYSSNGLGSLRQDNTGRRYVQESYTVNVRNYIEHELTAENN